MRIPLVVLAFFAFFGGVLNLPWVHTHDLESWLAPVFAGTLYNNTLSDAGRWALAMTDIAAALIGVIVGWWLWRGEEVDKPALEPAFLQRVWYWDDFYDTVIGRPGQRLATFCAWVVDVRIIDGAVNGAAHLVKATGTAARRLQTGYARNYALGIAVGLALTRRLHAEQDVVGMRHIVPYPHSVGPHPGHRRGRPRPARSGPPAAPRGAVRAGAHHLAGHARVSPSPPWSP